MQALTNIVTFQASWWATAERIAFICDISGYARSRRSVGKCLAIHQLLFSTPSCCCQECHILLCLHEQGKRAYLSPIDGACHKCGLHVPSRMTVSALVGHCTVVQLSYPELQQIGLANQVRADHKGVFQKP